MSNSPIYVEIRIRCDIDELWERTQNPALHQRWDLRFTDIEYLPRNSESVPQEFRYQTRIGFGVGIHGKGESTGEQSRSDGSRVSALKFWSDQPISLIREGSGYWRCIPDREGELRFLTWYDYRVRWGVAGRAIDRIFRPVIGWATAWSFDRLRLWIEDGIPPERSMRQATIHHGARAALAATWIYQGLVPKLLSRDSGERKLLEPIVGSRTGAVLAIVGVGEIALGVAHLARPSSSWPVKVGTAALPLLAFGALVSNRSVFSRPFNPASLSIAMGALGLIALASRRDLPSAARCVRVQPKEHK